MSMMSTSNDPLSSQTTTCRCVVIEADSPDRVKRLIRGLNDRGAEVELVKSSAAALAALSQKEAQVFIVSGVGEDDLQSLLATVRHRHSRTRCWQFDPKGAGLTPYIDAQPAAQPGSDELALIDAVVHRDKDLLAKATAAIAQRAGISQVSFFESSSQVPDNYAAVVVTVDGRDRGWLAVPAPATKQQLKPWAKWLAHWLMLDGEMGRFEQLSKTDELTGLSNRRQFDRRLRELVDEARQQQTRVTLLVFDIDDFKLYNDRFGHSAGDDILRESAKLMQSAVREQDMVARIGGDEFAVIFWDADKPREPDSQHPSDPLVAAQRFQQAICDHRFPKLADDAPATLTISGGLATFPRDGGTAQQLFDAADSMAIESKRNGKNVLTIGPEAAALAE